MKVLILIISSDTEPVYSEHKEIWSSYMNSNSQIECYFIQYRDGPQEIEKNTFWLRGVESFPAILTKTLDSLEHFLPNNYDFIIRTNMSSLWNFNALLKYLETLPREKVYNGIIGNHEGISFISGSGFIITPDVATLVIENRTTAESVKIMDDVDIGYTMIKLKIDCSLGKRRDFFCRETYNNFKYDNTIYHYRFKWHDYRMRYQEAEVMKDLLRKFNMESL